jgi:hypothetical protein
MSQKPGDGPESETPPSARERAWTADGEPERVGPLELRRLRKADGRALLLYERVEESQP